jgi:putative transposase
MSIDEELVDRREIRLLEIRSFWRATRSRKTLLGENGLLKQLTKALVEGALSVELTTHLGYETHSPEGHNSGNSRNGVSGKRLKGEFGIVEIEVPRDRQASFEPNS